MSYKSKFLLLSFLFAFMVFLFVFLSKEKNGATSPELIAEFTRGAEVLGQGKFLDAIEILKPVAEAGYIEANYWVGFAYKYSSFPNGTPYEEQLWYEKGAKAGDPYAMLALGARKYDTCYRFEQCSLWDHYWRWKANILLSKRAKQGDTNAEYSALRYLNSVSYDFDKLDERNVFYSKMKKIALKGNEKAVVDYYLSEDDYDAKPGEALKILKKQAESNGGEAAVYLAYYYNNLAEEGINPTYNYERAVFWFNKLIYEKNNSGIVGIATIYKGQPELDNYVNELYFYCRVLYEKGYKKMWCDPNSDGVNDLIHDIEISISDKNRKKIEEEAKGWSKENIFPHTYEYFSSYAY